MESGWAAASQGRPLLEDRPVASSTSLATGMSLYTQSGVINTVSLPPPHAHAGAWYAGRTHSTPYGSIITGVQ